jgi:hypothetical protein
MILLTSASARAGEIYEFYNGIRSLGMGGAYVTVVNDETSIYSNPAGLGKLRDMFITIVDPEMDFSGNLTDIIDFSNVSNAYSVQGLLNALNTNLGKHFHGRVQVSPSIVLPNFGIGLLGKYSLDGEVDPTGTTFTLNYLNDYALTLAYNFRFWDGIIKIGFNSKLINRIEANEEMPASTTGLLIKNIASEGVGISTDVGVILSAPIRFLPSIGAVVRDVGGTNFTLSDGMFLQPGDNRPQRQKQKLDAGFAIFPILGHGVRATLTGEVHDVLTDDTEEKQEIMRRVHAGLEFNIADFFFIRGGMNQRFWTTGFEFASERFQLQGTIYGEDIGTPQNPREDRRFIGKFALRF